MEQFSRRALVLTGAAVMMLAGCGMVTESIGTSAPATAAPSTESTISSTTEPSTVAPATTARTVEVTAVTTSEAETMAPPATEAPTTSAPVTYTVVKVVGGDTVDVAASDGNSFTVRLIGIEVPDASACEAALATETMTALVDGKTVALTAGADGEDTDGSGRALRYVDVDGVDIGLTMIEMGLAWSGPESRDGSGHNDREDSYVAADQASANYTCPPPSTTTPTTVAPAPLPTTPRPIAATPSKPSGGRCDPNYSGCVPIDSDVDCAGGKGNGPSYVAGPIRVVGVDIYDLDRDGDGIACE